MGFARRITRLTIVNTTTYNFFYRHSEGTKLLLGYIPFLCIVGVGLWICLSATIFFMVWIVVQFHAVVFTSCSYFVCISDLQKFVRKLMFHKRYRRQQTITSATNPPNGPDWDVVNEPAYAYLLELHPWAFAISQYFEDNCVMVFQQCVGYGKYSSKFWVHNAPHLCMVALCKKRQWILGILRSFVYFCLSCSFMQENNQTLEASPWCIVCIL